MLALIFAPPLGHPVHQRCPLLNRPARLQSDPLRCHHAGVSLTYTKSVSFPNPLSLVLRCSYRLLFDYNILYYNIVYFCTMHLIIYFFPHYYYICFHVKKSHHVPRPSKSCSYNYYYHFITTLTCTATQYKWRPISNKN